MCDCRVSSTWYAHEFPLMISRWRDAFGALALPFIYVELCREFGGYEPRTKDFWLAQRSALALPQVGFVTTTDIERNLHPPDKQDVARRLVLELRRLAYGEAVTARGPELVSITRSASEQVVLTFTNSTLHTHSGIYVGVQGQCAANAGTALDTVVTVAPKLNATAHGPQAGVAYTLGQGKGTLTLAKGVCGPGDWLWVSADISSCFLYGPTGLPAPPLFLTCPDLREKPEPQTALTPLTAPYSAIAASHHCGSCGTSCGGTRSRPGVPALPLASDSIETAAVMGSDSVASVINL